MSKIISKPFSWANKIINAVFKGAPNLITTSDLNRQIELLKKELYVLQQSSGVIISDLTHSVDTSVSSRVRISFSLSYVYCLGVKFDVSHSDDFDLAAGTTKELRLYAKKTLITSDDDFSKEISGAKFEDGTTQPAAEHYVYQEPVVLLVDGASSPNNNFEYPENSGKEYICTLFRAERASSSSYPKDYYVQTFTSPMGKNIMDVSDKYRKFDTFELTLLKNLPNFVPNSDDDWKTAVHKLWSRLYTLERRLFLETNGSVRRYSRTYEEKPDFGAVELQYSFSIVGSICFVAGYIYIPKNSMSSPTEKILSFDIGEGSDQLPYSKYYTNTACALVIQNRPDLNPSLDMNLIRGYIDTNKLCFVGIPAGGAHLYWYGVYCFNSEKFWDVSVGDSGDYFDVKH